MIVQNKVLFVDDERSLLNGIERRLGDDYDITTAECGADGLAAIEQHGPFPVIFTDMRMPRMDGVEFAEKGHALAPDSTFIMLTGNQDQTTAVSALNRGRVFRFLNKPCESAQLLSAIDDGLRQYKLVTHEKELLNKTFLGSVNILTDVLELAQPELAGRSEGIAKRVQILREAVGIDDRWEYRLACRLALVGFSLLPEEKRRAVTQASHGSDEALAALHEAPRITSQLVLEVPRLETISALFEQLADSRGAFGCTRPTKPVEVARVGGALLKAATHWDFLAAQGLESASLLTEMKALVPELPAAALEAIEDNHSIDDPVDSCVEISLEEAKPGMITCCDIKGRAGVTLVRSGRRLNDTILQQLLAYDEPTPMRVTGATLETP